jgi:hypothetical protein
VKYFLNLETGEVEPVDSWGIVEYPEEFLAIGHPAREFLRWTVVELDKTPEEERQA